MDEAEENLKNFLLLNLTKREVNHEKKVEGRRRHSSPRPGFDKPLRSR
jgi:hypothetical protein